MATTARFDQQLLARAKAVRVVFFDVDGVLTDGGLVFSAEGETLKRFHTLDGHGLRLLQQAGITPVIITGRDSQPLRHRLAALGISHAHFATEDKLPAAQASLKSLGLDWSQAAAMGDDWPDLPVMLQATIACAPPTAHYEAVQAAHYITQHAAGYGAARDFCDLILTATGHYPRFPNPKGAAP